MTLGRRWKRAPRKEPRPATQNTSQRLGRTIVIKLRDGGWRCQNGSEKNREKNGAGTMSGLGEGGGRGLQGTGTDDDEKHQVRIWVPPSSTTSGIGKRVGGDEIGADGKRRRGQGLNSPGTRLEFPGRDHAAYQPGGDGLNRQNGETRVTKQHPVQGLARRGTRTATTNDDTAEEAQMVWDAAGRKRGR